MARYCKPELNVSSSTTLSSMIAKKLTIVLMLILVSPTALVKAQGPNSEKLAEAMRIVIEAKKLMDQGTAESYRQAIVKFEAVLKITREIKDVFREGSTLALIAELYSLVGENQKAVAHLDQAVPLIHATGDRGSEGLLLSLRGNIQSKTGEKLKALESYRSGLLLLRSVNDRNAEAKVLNNIGTVLTDLGRVNEALEHYEQALTIFKSVSDSATEAETLTNLGLAYFELGDFQKALEAYAKSLPILEKVTDKHGEVALLIAIGLAHKYLGDSSKALDFFNRALSLGKMIGDQLAQANTLLNIGAINQEQGENARAIEHYEKGVTILKAINDKRGLARALVNIGNVYESTGNFGKARDLYIQAMPLMQFLGDKNGEAGTLSAIGVVEANSGDKRKAENLLNESLKLVEATGDIRQQAKTLKDIASLRRDLGDLDTAKEKIEASLALVESLRGKYTNQDFQINFFATVQSFYIFYIDLLMRMHKERPLVGYDGMALQASESARARALLDLLVQARANIRQGVDPLLLQKERELQQQLNAKSAARIRLLTGTFASDQAKSASIEIEALTTQYREVEANIRKDSPRYAALTQPKPLDLKGIQAQLDNETLLLEYSLGDKRSYLWLVSSTEIKGFELPARSEIEKYARTLHELLTVVTDPANKELSEAASNLSQVLLAPVAGQLGKKRLVIVADGALQYLPFAVLPDPAQNKSTASNGSLLLLQHEIVSLPSVAVLATLRSELGGRKPAPKDVAVFADPVFYPDDQRVKRNQTTTSRARRVFETYQPITNLERAARDVGALRNGDRLELLPKSREEAEGIVAFLSQGRFKKALDFEANRELVSSGELSQYRYLHFATHGLIDSIHPELTAIVLSLVDENGNPRDGYLRAHEIYNLNLPAEMVVLSACETALGKEIKGEGLISLTRAFMYAGAPRVVASLWAVRDESTAKLMVDFYREMIQEGKRPAEALRAAQLKMLKSKEWNAPHYWAPFVLQGEWR